MKKTMKRALFAATLCCFCVANVVAENHRRHDDGYLKAVRLLNQGIYFEAIGLLEEYIKDHPDNENAHLRLAQALYHVRHDIPAAEHAAAALRINPDNDLARRLLTRLRVKIGRELDYDNPEAVLKCARLCARTDSLDRASAFYRRFLEMKDDRTVRLEYARTLAWSAQYDESIKQYLLYLADTPDDFAARVELGRLCNSAGAFTEAADILADCLQEDPANRALQLDLARAYLWSGNIAKGRTLFEKLIAQPLPSKEEDLVFIASLAGTMGWVEDEHRACSRVLELNPDNEWARARSRELAESKAVEIYRLRREIGANPNSQEARVALIELLIARHRFDLAEPELRELRCTEEEREALVKQFVAARADFHSVARKGIDTLLATEISQRSERVQMCYQWLDAHPNDTRTRFLLANHLTSDRLFEEAAAQYARILEVFPNNPALVERLDKARQLARRANKEESAETESPQTGVAQR